MAARGGEASVSGQTRSAGFGLDFSHDLVTSAQIINCRFGLRARAVGHEDYFERLKRLLEDTFNSLPQHPSAIICRDDH
jgi:hypothetical protein